MFSWITGSRITNVIEDLQSDPAYDPTFIEPPDTPAHQFAAKAFKQALFGTPAPQDATKSGKKLEKKSKIDAANAKNAVLPAPKEGEPPSSPAKAGILMTPGTANKGRKTVSFGAQVVDNEGKRSNAGNSGIPSDCPGKFPSPWTPGTELLRDESNKEMKPRSKLTAALYDARATTQPKSGQKPKARDDSDITVDLGAPRSESGKYWKEQYETYAERTEKEMKKLVSKQQVAKHFAKKKDGEATEMTTRLAEERKRFRNRERELEQQNKDYQERLRQALAEKLSASMEITALKNRIAALEKSIILPSSSVQESKMSFQIYEDGSERLQPGLRKAKDVTETPSVILGRAAQSMREQTAGKENSPPKPRHMRRQTLPNASPRPAISHSTVPKPVDTDSIEAIAALASSPYVAKLSEEASLKAPSTFKTELPPKSPISTRKSQPSKENLPPQSPASVASSPLPQPSPDHWMQDFDNSPLPHMDRLALPISSGPSHSKDAKISHSHRTHRSSKSVTQAPKSSTSTAPSRADAKPASLESKLDVSKAAKHHATDTSSMLSRDRVPLPVDRKEQARRRLQERKQKKLEAA
ncbi:spindle pole body formation-associated protein-domain-containing protein [Lophiotrema nucula]|uniref:Spindle pole body formation-associated protein-domain-containing protein n=1 Tax=Lophiotrema nucula TaxID=690887 RepID=A0A6A5YI79_9PLEO|nr:spindle pole body formation-associated protein-domain-containing protein [Lophiotrema nucula]